MERDFSVNEFPVDGFEVLVKVAGSASVLASGESLVLSGWPAVSGSGGGYAVSAEFERRVLLAVTQENARRLSRRAGWAFVAAAACFVGLVMSFPLASIAASVGQTIEAIFV